MVVNLIINSVDLLSEKIQKIKFCCEMGLPIKIRELAYKMLYLCGKIQKKCFKWLLWAGK